MIRVTIDICDAGERVAVLEISNITGGTIVADYYCTLTEAGKPTVTCTMKRYPRLFGAVNLVRLALTKLVPKPSDTGRSTPLAVMEEATASTPPGSRS